jgi:Zn finger protein HypA/HybF involved in hydrogenase expression
MKKPYILDYSPPVKVRRKCKHCSQNLGAQNPGTVCDMCKSMKAPTI